VNPKQVAANRLPSGWVAAPIRQAIQPRVNRVRPTDHPKSKFIGMDHVEAHSTKIVGSRAASGMKSSALSFKAGDVLYGRLRPYLNKVAQPKFDGLASAEFIVFPDTELLRSHFLKHRLNAADFVSFASHLNEGDRPRVNFGQIGDFNILIPPPLEQRRIVSKIEELFSELDKGIESLKTARAQLKVYRQAVLNHALEGKLTAEWRKKQVHAKPAKELLKSILVEHRRSWEKYQLQRLSGKGKAPPKNWKAKYKEPAPANITDLPRLPNSWCWSNIDQLIREPLRNGHSAPVSQASGGIPIFSISAVTDGDFSTRNVKITSADPLKVHDLWVESDDIFVQRSNTPELVGTTRRYRGENARAIFPDLLIRIRVTSSVLPAFVELALQSVRCHTYFRHMSQGISGSMPKINQSVVRLAAIPLPPLSEQEVFIDAIEDQLSVVAHISAEIDNQLSNTDSLRKSILREAFAGQLVAQDSNDEPASVLLNRIRAERERLMQKAAHMKTPISA